MSSIVSRRPPFSVSTSQANDFFWMSIRLGTSRTLSSRANERRVRGASMEAKTATPLGLASGQRAVALDATAPRGRVGTEKARPTKIAQGEPDPCEGLSALTDPARPGLRMWRRRRCGRLRLSADSSQCTGGGKRPAAAPPHAARRPRTPTLPERRRAPRGALRGKRDAPPAPLLDLYARAGLLELGQELVGLLALDALLDRLGSLVDERLGLLETEAGGRAHDLDDLDLLVARAS